MADSELLEGRAGVGTVTMPVTSLQKVAVFVAAPVGWTPTLSTAKRTRELVKIFEERARAESMGRGLFVELNVTLLWTHDT
jgi:hypothetical protein